MNHERYSRQTILKDFGLEAQQKLSQAKVLVVGAGGLGVPVLTYLNAMGIGTLGIVDADTISITNLNRQVLYSADEIGQLKVDIAIKKLGIQNPDSIVKPYVTFLTRENALEIIEEFDLVVDATDNFPTRYLINDACVILNKSFIYGALHGFEGQVSVFNYKGGPTYRCLFPKMPNADEIPNCNEHGVLGVIPGIVGNLQALEVIKILTGIGKVLSGKLLLYNGLQQSIHKIRFASKPENLMLEELQKDYSLKCNSEMKTIEANEFESLHQSEKIIVIDVRTYEEYERFHITNTINHPLSEIEVWKDKLDFKAPIYLICQSGVRSQTAQSILHTYKPKADLINVNGGLIKLNIHVA